VQKRFIKIGTILHGTATEKEKLKGQHFHLADTPQFMKDLGLEGDYFSIRYGVITHHKGKDADHDLSEENWKDLCDAITNPLEILQQDKNRYGILVNIKVNNKNLFIVADIKSVGRDNIKINSI
jgi:hypothetical protein